MKKLLLSITALSAICSGSAKATRVINKTDRPITVYFQAYRCFKLVSGSTCNPLSRICMHKKNVKPGQQAKYDWKWGQTGRKVYIDYDATKHRKDYKGKMGRHSDFFKLSFIRIRYTKKITGKETITFTPEDKSSQEKFGYIRCDSINLGI